MKTWLVLALTAGGCIDTVDIDNPEEAPRVRWVYPTEAVRLPPGRHTFIVDVSDPQDDPERLFVIWTTVPDEGTLEPECAQNADEDGRAQCTIVMDPSMTGVRVIAKDIAGYQGEGLAEVEISEDAAPDVTDLLAPPGRLYEGLPFEVQGQVVEGTSPLRDLTIRWWTSLGQEPSGFLYPSDAGELRWQVELPEGPATLFVEADDPAGGTDRESLSIVVGPANTDPSCGYEVVQPEREGILPDEVVSLRGFGSDPEQDPASLVAVWSVEGTALPTSWSPEDRSWGAQWSPGEIGSYALRFTVEDEVGASCEESFTATVDVAPELTWASSLTYAAGSSATLEVEVSEVGLPGAPYTVQWDIEGLGSLPETTLSEEGLTVLTVPSLPSGEVEVEVTVIDARGLSRRLSQVLSITP